MDRNELVERLDEELRTTDYADVDASANGLQVSRRSDTVEHVAFAVDAASATIETAVESGADLLVTHHGISWGGIERVTGRTYERLAPLVANDVGLYVSHLPLDGHRELGNAAGVGDVLGLESRTPFGALGSEFIGQRGSLEEPATVTDLGNALERTLDTGGQSVRTFEFGPEEITDVAIVTGSGTDWLDEAVEAGVDALVTGEGKGKVYHEAREGGVHVLLAGHYATETFGVRALETLVAGWGLETTFVDHPTGI